MRISRTVLVSVLVLGFSSGTSWQWASAQGRPSAPELFERLRSDQTTNAARKQLLDLGKSDPETRNYLAAQLPLLIDLGPESCPQTDTVDLVTRWHACPWYNAIELAGNLRIAEASPALARWINWRVEGPLLPSIEAQLIFYPAAKALYEIGDPAIPVLQHILNSSGGGEHAQAVRVLCKIRSVKAKAALSEQLAREADPGLRTMIKNAMRH